MTKIGNLTLIALAMAYMLVVGADLFGQAVLMNMAMSEPPRSLFLFHGPVPYESEGFWRTLTMLVTVLGVLAVATNWTKSRRLWVGGFFVAWIILNALSFAFVFPEYQAIQAIPYSDSVDPDLVARAEAQELRGAIRWVIAFLMGAAPLIALTKPR